MNKIVTCMSYNFQINTQKLKFLIVSECFWKKNHNYYALDLAINSHRLVEGIYVDFQLICSNFTFRLHFITRPMIRWTNGFLDDSFALNRTWRHYVLKKKADYWTIHNDKVKRSWKESIQLRLCAVLSPLNKLFLRISDEIHLKSDGFHIKSNWSPKIQWISCEISRPFHFVIVNCLIIGFFQDNLSVGFFQDH